MDDEEAVFEIEDYTTQVEDQINSDMKKASLNETIWTI